MRQKRLLGSLLLFIVAIIWGTAFAFQRVGMDQIEPMTFCASRMTLSAVIVGLVSLLRKKNTAFADDAEEITYRRNTLLGGIGCGVFLALASLFQQKGIVYTTAGKAGFITALYILIVPIINAVFFKKRNSWLVWFAVLLGVFGMYLLCISGSFRLAYGDALICVCAVVFSGHILCCDHFVKHGDPVRMSAIQFLVTSAICWIAAFIFEHPGIPGIVSAVIPILYCGIASGGIGYTLQIVAQKYTDPTVASLLMSLESVFAVTAGALILKERMTAKEFLGCIVMFIAIIIVQIPVKMKEENEESKDSFCDSETDHIITKD